MKIAFFVFCLALWIPFISVGSEVSEDRKVMLFLDLHGQDSFRFLNDFHAVAVKKELEKKFPHQRSILIFPSHLEDLYDQLGMALQPDEVISHLFITGHGHSEEEEFRSISVMSLGNNEEIRFCSAKKAHYDYLVPKMNDAASRIFSPIHGRFDRNSKIILTNCYLLKGVSLLEQLQNRFLSAPEGQEVTNGMKLVEKKLETIQNILGQADGEIYANQGLGVPSPFLSLQPAFSSFALTIAGGVNVAWVLISGQSGFSTNAILAINLYYLVEALSINTGYERIAAKGQKIKFEASDYGNALLSFMQFSSWTSYWVENNDEYTID